MQGWNRYCVVVVMDRESMGLTTVVKCLDCPCMSATITVSVRFPLKQAAMVKRAAKQAGLKLATFVRKQSYLGALAKIKGYAGAPEIFDEAAAMVIPNHEMPRIRKAPK